MKAPHLLTADSDIQLIEPDLERDAALGVQWLEGELGRRTLALMGVADKDNRATTIEEERERVKSFIENENQLNWMIQLDGRVVGSIWVDLKPVDSVPAPGIHIMIGDPESRGRGVGTASAATVINYLKQRGEEAVYSRTLASNTTAAKLLQDNGFIPSGEVYSDEDGLQWQNQALYLT